MQNLGTQNQQFAYPLNHFEVLHPFYLDVYFQICDPLVRAVDSFVLGDQSGFDDL